MEDFKHIRTSILPFGTRTDESTNLWYRFSLCIDINPNFPSEGDDKLLVPSLVALQEFIKTFGIENKSVHEKLIKNLKVKIVQGQKAISVSQLCFQSLSDKVPTVWNELNKSLPKRTDKRSDKIKNFAPSFDLSANSTTSLFGKNSLPDTDQPRKKAIEAFATIKSKQLKIVGAAKIDNVFSADLKTDIHAFNDKLNGITLFSDETNTQEYKALHLADELQLKDILDTIDTILDFWSVLDSNILLQRLSGKTIDFEIPKKVLEDSLPEGIDAFGIVFDFPESIPEIANLNWEHLETPMKIYRELNVLVVEEAAPIQNVVKQYQAKNHDIGGKLVGLKTVEEKYKNYIEQLKDPSKKESERNAIIKQLLSVDTAALTTGMSMYNSNLSEVLKAEEQVEAGNLKSNYLYRITRGYRFFAKSEKSQFLPLGTRAVTLKGSLGAELNALLPKEFTKQEFAINTDAGSHAILKEEITKPTGAKEEVLKKKVILDQALLTWSGENIGMPSAFSNQEKEENFEAIVDEGSTTPSTKLVLESMSKFFMEDYETLGVEYTNTLTETEKKKAIVKLNTNKKIVPLLFEYSSSDIKNKKLLFGKNIQILAVPEYKNGFAIDPKFLTKIQSNFIVVDDFTFKRNEPVKPIELYLQEKLVNEKGEPECLREGESLTHLVIRNCSRADNDKIYKTTQTSVRHILPPAISFQQAFWHNKLFKKDGKTGMDLIESYNWYMKYHFPAIEDEVVMFTDMNGNWVPKEKPKKIGEEPTYWKYDLEESIKGSTRMRDAYSGNCNINYLPDPLSKGFRFEFYKNKERTIKAENYEKYEQLEFYFTGKYPNINAWKIILKDYDHTNRELLTFNTVGEEIVIHLEKGQEIFVTARTILNEKYEAEFETYGNYNDFTRYGNNDLLTPPLEFSMIHAIQRPLVRPKFMNTLKCIKQKDKTIVSYEGAVHLEQINIYKDEAGIVRFIDETMPTGNVEIYAKWEEYKDDPKHVTTVNDSWTPLNPVNKVNLDHFESNLNDHTEMPAIFETSVDVQKQLGTWESSIHKIADDNNDSKNYSVTVNLNYDIKETKFVEKIFWIKNKSKFTAYYPKTWGVIEDNKENKIKLQTSYESSAETFNRLSYEPFHVKILNSKKPGLPIIADKNITLVSVIEDWKEGNSDVRKITMNRLRFFFERGRLTSGQGERIGFVVNEVESKYNDYFVGNGLVSMVGRDVLSDTVKPYDGLNRNEGVLLARSNFDINDPFDLTDMAGNKLGDLEDFSPKYVKELGIMTYLPKFDKSLNLWYVDAQLDINDASGKELHSPFLKFFLVHYQENSSNYNIEGEYDISKDCRISETFKSRYAYIMGSRTITIDYGKWFIQPKLQFDITTLKGDPSENLSKFYAVVRHRKSGTIKWDVADKEKENDRSAFLKLSNLPGAENEKLHYINYSNTEYQVVIIETEDWGNDNDTNYDNIIENKNSRIVLSNVFTI